MRHSDIDRNGTLSWAAAHFADPVEGEGMTDAPDADAIDRALGWREPGEIEATDPGQLAEAVVKVVELLLPPRLCRQGVTAAGLRCLALAWMLDAGGIRQYSQGELAERAGFTTAALSAAVKSLEAATGLRCRGMTTKAGCEAHKDGARRGWVTRRERRP